MANKRWRREARVLEAAYDLKTDDEVWALHVLVELSHTADGAEAATAHVIRGGQARLVASVGDAAIIADVPLSIHLPVDSSCAWLFSLALSRDTKLSARESLRRVIPHLRTAAGLREGGRGGASAPTLLELGHRHGVRTCRGEDVAAAWQDLLSGKLSRVALLRDGRGTHVIAVRSELGDDPRGLTSRELSIAARCAVGEANKSIAIDLGLSPVTVSAELCSAMEKLGLTSRAELVAWFGEQRAAEPMARAS
jgi:DNA-binding CsgD family transcriptional regulator